MSAGRRDPVPISFHFGLGAGSMFQKLSPLQVSVPIYGSDLACLHSHAFMPGFTNNILTKAFTVRNIYENGK